MSVFKKTASGLLIGAVGTLVSTVVGLWAMRLVYRGLGPDYYAIFGLFQGVQGALLLLLSSVGQNAILVLLAGDQDADALARRSRGMSAWSVVAAAAALLGGWLLAWPLVGAWFWHDALSLSLWVHAAPWAGLSWSLQIFCQALWSGQRARLRLPQAELQQSLGAVLPTLAGPLALALGGDLVAVIQFQGLAWLVMLVLGLAWERFSPGRLDLLPREDREVWRQSMRIAGWSALALGSTAVLQYGDRLFSLRIGAHELSAYSLGTSLTLRATAALGALGPLIVPSLAGARGDAPRWAALQSLYMRVTGLVAGAAFVPLAAGGAVLVGAWVVDPEMQSRASLWMLLLSTGALAATLSNAYFAVMLGYGGEKAGAWAAAGGVAAGLVAGFAAQAHGLPAAAWMSVVGNTVAVLLRGYAVARQGLGRPGWGWLAQVAPWLALALVGGWLLRLSGFPGWFGSGLVTLAAVFAVTGTVLLAFGLAADEVLSRGRGRLSVWSQVRRLLPGRMA